ncbi:hypothetical protein STEG23_011752, partial [Scotinomys teguina]
SQTLAPLPLPPLQLDSYYWNTALFSVLSLDVKNDLQVPKSVLAPSAVRPHDDFRRKHHQHLHVTGIMGNVLCLVSSVSFNGILLMDMSYQLLDKKIRGLAGNLSFSVEAKDVYLLGDEVPRIEYKLIESKGYMEFMLIVLAKHIVPTSLSLFLPSISYAFGFPVCLGLGASVDQNLPEGH